MDLKGSKSLSLPNLHGEKSDFLSRCVNLTSDMDSECSFSDDATDILSSEWDVVKLAIYSREPSREELCRIKGHDSRKSSLEKPIGHIMQLNPNSFVNDNRKETFWENVLISRESPRSKDKTGQSQNGNGLEIQTNANTTTGTPTLLMSKSADVVSKCDSSGSNQGKDASLPTEQTPQNRNHFSQKNTLNINNNKCFSVYSKNFHLNSKFLSKSYYAMSYWKQSKSFPLENERTFSPSDSETDKKRDFIGLPLNVINKTKFNLKSWMYDYEPLPKLTSLNSKHGKEKAMAKKPTRTRIRNEKDCRKSMPNHGSTISLPAICNLSVVSSRPRNFGQFSRMSTSCDNLLKQYQRKFDLLTKKTSRKRRIESKSPQK